MVSSVDFQLTSELDATAPTFNLTCISTGGPATTVTWTRNSRVVTDDSVHHITSQVLINGETATYNHILMVTRRLVGVYECNVSNNKPSSSSRMLAVVGKNNNYKSYLGASYLLAHPPKLYHLLQTALGIK